jgi:hypothetical protein
MFTKARFCISMLKCVVARSVDATEHLASSSISCPCLFAARPTHSYLMRVRSIDRSSSPHFEVFEDSLYPGRPSRPSIPAFTPMAQAETYCDIPSIEGVTHLILRPLRMQNRKHPVCASAPEFCRLQTGGSRVDLQYGLGSKVQLIALI